jgi:hypothetical protein
MAGRAVDSLILYHRRLFDFGCATLNCAIPAGMKTLPKIDSQCVFGAIMSLWHFE